MNGYSNFGNHLISIDKSQCEFESSTRSITSDEISQFGRFQNCLDTALHIPEENYSICIFIGMIELNSGCLEMT